MGQNMLFSVILVNLSVFCIVYYIYNVYLYNGFTTEY